MNIPSSGDTIVCKEVFDENSEPTVEEVKEYAERIGIDPSSEPELLPLAKEGIMQKLPPYWRPCWDDALGRYYYFNFKTGETKWEHPLDDVYRELVKKSHSDSLSSGVDEDSRTSLKEDLKSEELVSAEMLPKSESLLPAGLSNVENLGPRRGTVTLAPLKRVPKLGPINSTHSTPSEMVDGRHDSPSFGVNSMNSVIPVGGRNSVAEKCAVKILPKGELTLSGGGSSFLKKQSSMDSESSNGSSNDGAAPPSIKLEIVSSRDEPQPKSILRDPSPLRSDSPRNVAAKLWDIDPRDMTLDEKKLWLQQELDEDRKCVRFNLDVNKIKFNMSDEEEERDHAEEEEEWDSEEEDPEEEQLLARQNGSLGNCGTLDAEELQESSPNSLSPDSGQVKQSSPEVNLRVNPLQVSSPSIDSADSDVSLGAKFNIRDASSLMPVGDSDSEGEVKGNINLLPGINSDDSLRSQTEEFMVPKTQTKVLSSSNFINNNAHGTFSAAQGSTETASAHGILKRETPLPVANESTNNNLQTKQSTLSGSQLQTFQLQHSESGTSVMCRTLPHSEQEQLRHDNDESRSKTNEIVQEEVDFEAENMKMKLLIEKEEMVDSLRRKFATQVKQEEERLRQQMEERLKLLETEIKRELEEKEAKMRTKRLQSLENIQEEMSRLQQNQLLQLEKEKQVILADFKVQLEDAVSADKTQIQVEHQGKLEKEQLKIRAQHETEIEELKMRLAEDLQQRKTVLMREHDEKIDDLNLELQKLFSSVKNQKLTELSALRDQEKVLSEQDHGILKEKKEQLKKEQQKQLEQMRDYHKTIIEKLEKEHREKEEMMKHESEEEIQKLMERLSAEHENHLQEVQDRNQLELDNLQQQCDSEQEVMKQTLTRIRSQTFMEEIKNKELNIVLEELRVRTEVEEGEKHTVPETSFQHAEKKLKKRQNETKEVHNLAQQERDIGELLQKALDPLTRKLLDGKQQSMSDSTGDEFGLKKLKQDKLIIEEKYRYMKEKYKKLREDVRNAMETKKNRKEVVIIEDDKNSISISEIDCKIHDMSRQAENNVVVKPFDKNNSIDTILENLENKPVPLEDVELPNKQSTPKFTHSHKSQSPGCPSPVSSDREVISEIQTQGKEKLRPSLSSSSCHSKPRELLWSPVESLKEQLKKLEDLGDLIPLSTHGDSYFRYPFNHAETGGSSELAFFQHRIHLERSSIQRAKEFLQHQKKTYVDRQQELSHIRQQSQTVVGVGQRLVSLKANICQENELSEMELKMHHTKSLLGEKMIRLRHLEKTLRRLSSSSSSDEAERVRAADVNLSPERQVEDTLSDLSSESGSSGISSSDLGVDNVFAAPMAQKAYKRKGTSYQDSSQILGSLRRLTSQITDIWSVLKRHNSLPDSPSGYQYKTTSSQPPQWRRQNRASSLPRSGQLPPLQPSLLQSHDFLPPPSRAWSSTPRLASTSDDMRINHVDSLLAQKWNMYFGDLHAPLPSAHVRTSVGVGTTPSIFLDFQSIQDHLCTVRQQRQRNGGNIAEPSLAERTKDLRNWLRQTRIECNLDLVPNKE